MMSDRQLAAIRSFLFTPANHPRRVEKVFQVGADAVILDLEDAVAVAEKVATRAKVVAAFKQSHRHSRHYVRVNGHDTDYCRDDMLATVGPWLDGVVIPKVESAAALWEVDHWLSEAEERAGLTPGSIDLLPIVETARGVEEANAIATAGTRVTRLAFGGGDYTLDLDYIWTADEEVLSYARARLSHASRLGNLLPPVDTVVLQIKDHPRFEASARRGRAFGFSGMEVETICRYNLPICVVVFNNGGIYRGTDVNPTGGEDVAPTVFVKDARYDKMMEAFGGVGYYVTSPDDLKRAVNEAMDFGKPALINAVIDENAGTESGRIGNLNPQSVVAKK